MRSRLFLVGCPTMCPLQKLAKNNLKNQNTAFYQTNLDFSNRTKKNNRWYLQVCIYICNIYIYLFRSCRDPTTGAASRENKRKRQMALKHVSRLSVSSPFPGNCPACFDVSNSASLSGSRVYTALGAFQYAVLAACGFPGPLEL